MSLKKFHPITPSLRHLSLIDNFFLWKGSPVKSLTSGFKNSSGRNNTGRITVRHRGGGHKQSYRSVDFFRSVEGFSIVTRLEYDPNRSSFLALLHSSNNSLSYILCPRGLKIGDKISVGTVLNFKSGNAFPLSKIPLGSTIHNVEQFPGTGGLYVRSAGAYAQLISKNLNTGLAILRLPSGERRLFSLSCKATLGSVSNLNHKEVILGKAGRSRWLNKRPSVRGVAMNPIDHPHGGGEGKTSAGRHPVTPWGRLTKGKRTRSVRKVNSFIIQRRYEK